MNRNQQAQVATYSTGIPVPEPLPFRSDPIGTNSPVAYTTPTAQEHQDLTLPAPFIRLPTHRVDPEAHILFLKASHLNAPTVHEGIVLTRAHTRVYRVYCRHTRAACLLRNSLSHTDLQGLPTWLQ